MVGELSRTELLNCGVQIHWKVCGIHAESS